MWRPKQVTDICSAQRVRTERSERPSQRKPEARRISWPGKQQDWKDEPPPLPKLPAPSKSKSLTRRGVLHQNKSDELKTEFVDLREKRKKATSLKPAVTQERKTGLELFKHKSNPNPLIKTPSYWQPLAGSVYPTKAPGRPNVSPPSRKKVKRKRKKKSLPITEHIHKMEEEKKLVIVIADSDSPEIVEPNLEQSDEHKGTVT